MPNNENGYTAIESSPPTPQSESNTGAITSINPEIPDAPSNQPVDLSKRRLMGLGALAAGATIASMVMSPQTLRMSPEEISAEEQEFISVRNAIQETYGFEVEETYGNIGLAKIKEIHQALSIFPRDFAYMISFSIKPALVGIDHTTPDLRLFTGLKIRFTDFSQTEHPNWAGSATLEGIDAGLIQIDKNCRDLKTVLYHEIGHMAHATVGGPIISSVNYYRGDDWGNIDDADAQKIGFSRGYGTRDTLEDFATSQESVLLDKTVTQIDYDKINPSNIPAEYILKSELIKEALAIVTHGKMDKQYFADLAEGKVDLAYMDNKKPSEFWKYEGPEKASVYMTDLDKKDPAKQLPAVITAVQRPLGTYTNADNTTQKECGVQIGGKMVSLEPVLQGTIINLVIDDYKQPIIIPEIGTETFVSINTPEVKMEVVIVNDNGNVYFKGNKVAFRSIYPVEKDDFSSDKLDELFALSTTELAIISTIFAANAGAAAVAAEVTNRIVENKSSNTKPSRRRFLQGSVGAAVFGGLAALEHKLSSGTAPYKKVLDKAERIAQIKQKTFAEYFRTPPFLASTELKKLVEY